MLYSDSSLRAPRDILEKNQLGQSALWPHGISGDLPIVLVRIDDENDLEIVKQLLRAHEYWRLKRLAVDLVILNDRPPSYASELQLALDSAIRTSQARRDEDGSLRGAVFSLRADLLPSVIGELLQTAARAVFVARRGTLSDQLARLREPEPLPRRRRQIARRGRRAEVAARATPALEFFNGLGGFAAEGREYVVVLDEAQWTPAPWINVIANAQFGFLASADGSGSTWSLNAQQNQITPWSNDPVGDAPAEAIYVRDEETGDLWSATPLPIREPSQTYVVRHGFGYSRYEHTSHGIALDLLQFVPLEDSIKISRLKIINQSGRNTATVHHALLGLGAGKSARQNGALHRHRRSTQEPGPDWRAIPGAMDFSRASPSWTWRAGSKPARPIAPSSSAVTDRWPSLRRCSTDTASRIAWAQGWIPAVRCKPKSACGPASRPSLGSCSARRHRPPRPLP